MTPQNTYKTYYEIPPDFEEFCEYITSLLFYIIKKENTELNTSQILALFQAFHFYMKQEMPSKPKILRWKNYENKGFSYNSWYCRKFQYWFNDLSSNFLYKDDTT
jgi:hypothetical protein